MSVIRILQVVTIMNRGGAETLLMNLYRKIDRKKIQFDFLTHRLEKGDYDDEITAMGGKVYYLPSIRPQRYGKYFKELDEFFLKHPEYKIVHSHINENTGFVLRAAKKAGVPVRIAHSHLGSLPLDYKLPFRYYGRHYLKDNCTNYFACSKDAGRWLFGHAIKKGEKITVLKNGVDCEEFKFSSEVRASLRKELGVEDRFVIGHVGRFEKQKNHTFIINVFKEVTKIRSDAVLLLIGTGKLKESIERKVRVLGLEDSVKFLGVRKDIPQLMQAFDVFFFPSLFEGLPVALVEAQTAGLKCIVSDCITRESEVGKNRLHFIGLDKDKHYWAKEIANLESEHEDTRMAVRKRGFDINIIAKKMQRFYSDQHNRYAEAAMGR
ncbi:glycosyltransferase family 1 protein [Clostridium thermarum]|uniref:glycosyltransferase family 1 protein n=1 Tax=Clostridium thermarum TaxID=1716543 RepID=UPI00193F3860|nr:glycosyltransferase family 1 protein [Clostridium thermarum]